MRVVFFCEQKWKSGGGGGDIYSEYVIVVVVIIAKGQKIALIMIFLREVHGCFFLFCVVVHVITLQLFDLIK